MSTDNINPIPNSTQIASTPSSITPVQLNYQIHHKLTEDNFSVWKSQVLPLIQGLGLMPYLDGSLPPPSPSLTSTYGTTASNPSYDLWFRQDKLVLAWLFSTLSAPVLNQVLSSSTARELWSNLQRIYSAQSLAKVFELRLLLQTTKKEGSSCSEYIQKMKSLADQLRSAGAPISDQDLLINILAGLGPDYDTVVTSYTMNKVDCNLADLHGYLLSHEARLKSRLLPTASPLAHAASLYSPNSSGLLGPTPNTNQNLTQNSTTTQDPQLFFTNPQNMASAQSNQQNYRPSYTNSNRNRSNGSSRGKGRNNQNRSFQNKPQCQICATYGHTADRCYYRFNYSYQPPPPRPPQAFVAAPITTPSENWFLDSGASSHIIADLNLLSNHTFYQGDD